MRNATGPPQAQALEPDEAERIEAAVLKTATLVGRRKRRQAAASGRMLAALIAAAERKKDELRAALNEESQ